MPVAVASSSIARFARPLLKTFQVRHSRIFHGCQVGRHLAVAHQEKRVGEKVQCRRETGEGVDELGGLRD